ncbi:MAG: stage II sporulation protein M [Candidatus Bathyarchaeales archaeon]
MGLQTSSWLGKGVENRLLWVFVFFVVAIIVMAVGASLPVNKLEAEKFYEEFKTESQYIDTVPFIFGNNFMHTLIMFVPFLGPIYGMFVFFNTGIILAMIAVASGVNVALLFAVLFLFPHAWLEFLAYSLALSQSLLLALAIFKGRLKQELKRACIVVTVCALILLLAAVVEVILISSA